MKARVLGVVMAICFVFLLCLPGMAVAGITDINGHWAQVHIEKWLTDGLIAGYPDGQFKPDREITRAEFVALVNRAFEKQSENAAGSFSDVKPPDWFYDEVVSAKAAGYISGYPDGTFKPYNAVTRQEAAVMLTKLLGLAPEVESTVESFSDYHSIDQWAIPGINAVTAQAIMHGFPDKTFGAQNNITRAEAVVTLDRALAYQGDGFLGVKGTVKMNNQPVKGATVRIFVQDSSEVLKDTVTGEDGGFSFEVPGGEYELTAVQDKNVGYAGITVTKARAAANQEILLAEGARVSGTIQDNRGNPLKNVPFAFTANPSFVGNTDNNGSFSIVLPVRGNNGQVLSYTGFVFYNGTLESFAANRQFSGDTNLGQLRTNIPGSPSGGGGGGGDTRPPDTMPPAWVAGFPDVADITQDGFKVRLKADESGNAYYVVLADGAAVPTVAEVKNGTGNGGAAAIKSGNTVLQANTEASVNVSGLDAGTSYDIYVVAEDAVPNLQASPLKLDVTTLVAPDTTPPSLQSAAVNGSTLVLAFSEKLDPSSQPLDSDFSVKVNSIEQAAPVNVAISGTQVTITLAEAVKSGAAVTLSYTPGASPIRDESGNNAAAFTSQLVPNNTGVLVAPPIDPTAATSLFESTAFLYSGNNAVQTGMAPGTIEEKRAAVIRGKVLNRDNVPLSDVLIAILNHPEFGSTLSRSDGYFDMAVNGGGLLTVSYKKDGYLTAQRQVNVPWNDFDLLQDVVLIPYDSTATNIDLADAGSMQVARGSQVTDSDGTRKATLIFPAGVQAEMEMPDGTKKPLTTMTVRATEYTVGANGPQAMPAELPANVGYTYCVEYSADEAVAAGATRVSFDEPVIHYVENFIGFPVGGIVPMGYYDYEQAAWIPSKNGRVIKILSINDGMVDLDIDGSGLAANAEALAAMGVTDAERQKLATLYQPGDSLWRVPITHFTPWDCNWPYGPPVGSTPPNQPAPKIHIEDYPCTGRGSIIEYQNQVLGETAKVFGTSFTLNYRSSRVEGYKNTRTVQIPLSGATVPDSLKSIVLEINIAGNLITKTFSNEPNQSYEFIWDGKDVYGRTIQGSTPINVRIGYVYPIVYLSPANFEAAFGSYSAGSDWEVSRGDNLEVTMWQAWSDKISFWDNYPIALGGWSLNVHHSYDPNSQILYLGDGQSSVTSGTVITTVAGDGRAEGTIGDYGDGGPAIQAWLNNTKSIAIGDDGSLYLADTDNHRIRKVSRDGIITTVAGSWQGYSGDGGPAAQARLFLPENVALGPDGSIYIMSAGYPTVRKVFPNGIITTVVGNPEFERGYSGDGGPATEAQLNHPSSMAVGPDGSLYIADWGNHCIRRVDPSGIITTVAGTGGPGYSGDGGPASRAQLNSPAGIAVDPYGNLYIGDYWNHRIRRVGTDGMITTVAGKGYSGYSGEGGPAIEANFTPEEVTVAPDGSLYFAANQRILRVGPDGIITTVAGTGELGYNGDNGVPTKAQLNCGGSQVAIGKDGSIYFADSGNGRIRRIGQPFPGLLADDLVIPAEGGAELYVFDGSGRHKRTINAITGSDIYTFTYDDQNRLTQVKDAFANVTRTEWDDQGNPTAIVAPGGQTTWLEVNEDGYLSSIICPLFKETNLEYTSAGLLTSLSDHKDNVHRFTYDELGRLVKDEDPAGGYSELSRSELDNGYEVSITTAEGLVSKYRVEHLATYDRRRVNTDASGAETVILIKKDGTRQVTYPDGTMATMVVGPDPRLAMGMRVPVTKEFTITTPGGLTSTVTRERTAEMTDANDLLSVTQIKDVLNNNGNFYESTYDIDRTNQTMTLTTSTPEGRQTVSTVDWYGRLIEETTAGLEPVSYSYDEKGHLASIQQGEQCLTYTYDDMNRVSSLEDAAGDKFQYTYNGADLLTGITVPGGQVYQLGYDANGNTTTITMPSRAIHQLGYTTVDLGESYTPPENTSYQKSYNKDRAVTRLTLPGGRTVDYEYDSGGRITGMAHDSVQATFGYNDLTDRVAGIERAPDGINYSFAYDGSLPAQMTVSVSGEVYGEYSYRYDNNFNLIGFTANGEREVLLEYDLDGLMTKYGDFSIEHNGPLGAPSQISDRLMTATYAYDNLGRPVKRTSTVNGSQVYSLDLTYDNTGMIRSKNETVAAAVYGYRYTYDANKQLNEVKREGAVVESYTYDENGNRLTGEASYDTQDRLTRLGDVVYQFNADGFLTQRGGDTFEYTAMGELRKATLQGGQEVTYTYDGLGRRVGRSVVAAAYEAPVTEHYLYGNPDYPFQVTSLRDNSGAVSQYYYDESNFLFAIKQGADWYYAATDQQGTPRVVSDASGQVVKVMEYDSYGNLTYDSKPGFQLPFGYAGGIADPDTRMVHFGQRDYDPAAGRWTARDPILFNGQQGNLYVYVNNNPVNLRDPFGLFCIGGTAYGGAGGGGQLCITGEGVSICAEVGFGIGGGVEVSPFGGLARAGSTVGVQGGLSFAGIGPSAGLTLDDCGTLKFTGGLSAGPFSKSGSYDFLEGKWSAEDATVGGEAGDLNKSVGESFKPKIGGNLKIFGQKCMRL